MLPFRRGASVREPLTLPLFPLKAVLFPGGLLPLKVFEQRYIDLTKRCLKEDQPFGVCLLTRGEEIAQRGVSDPEFAMIGTLARITSWDMPHLGILQLKTEGGSRFRVQSHRTADDGLVIAQASPLAPEPTVPLPEIHQPLAALLELMINRVGPENFAGEPALDDASWVGYRLAELLPLPVTIKQTMLEINDSEVRLTAIAQFLKQQNLL